MRSQRKDGAAALVVASPRLADLAIVANREHHLAVQSGEAMIQHAIRSGEALLAIQPHIGDESWMKWIAENFDGHHSTANIYMRVAAHKEALPETGIGIRAAVEALRGLPMVGMTTRVTHQAPEHVKAEALRLHRAGMSHRQIAKAVGVSTTTVTRWVNPKAAKQHRDTTRHRRERERRAREALRRQERDRAARRAGGSLGEAYSATRKAAETYERAMVESDQRAVSAALRFALAHLYKAEDEIVRALGLS